jgi:hypothetical protein
MLDSVGTGVNVCRSRCNSGHHLHMAYAGLQTHCVLRAGVSSASSPPTVMLFLYVPVRLHEVLQEVLAVDAVQSRLRGTSRDFSHVSLCPHHPLTDVSTKSTAGASAELGNQVHCYKTSSVVDVQLNHNGMNGPKFTEQFQTPLPLPL